MTYRPMYQELSNAPGVEPTRLDFKLVRGIPVQGKVTNRTTGKPVAAFVEYRPTLENPNLSSSSDVSLFEPIATRPDGSFTLSALPGPGVVVATVMDDRFLTADRARADRPRKLVSSGLSGASLHRNNARRSSRSRWNRRRRHTNATCHSCRRPSRSSGSSIPTDSRWQVQSSAARRRPI